MLNGANPSTVNPPNKNGAKNITKNLLFNNFVKLNSKSFFQFCTFHNNLYF